ncbi:hypothetical protein N7456_007742 [Penicillium angulare]|uniref:Uncharacterized protein n=1 Tax=Penicillium angulare TaxID=116970 RepID=A0A9W9K914_9EURO|nr:hypothetical protein N7456_007742 [Penicillium angulare]
MFYSMTSRASRSRISGDAQSNRWQVLVLSAAMRCDAMRCLVHGQAYSRPNKTFSHLYGGLYGVIRTVKRNPGIEARYVAAAHQDDAAMQPLQSCIQLVPRLPSLQV